MLATQVLTEERGGELETGDARTERVYFVSRYERAEQANGSNPHIRAIEFVSVVALVLVALAQLTQIFAAP